MKRSTGIVIAAISGAVSFAAYYYLATWLKAADPWFVASMLMTAIVIHEMAHLAAFEAFGIKTHLVFLVILGGAIPDPEYEREVHRLPSWKKATVYLAGVCGNLAIVAVAGLLCAAGIVESDAFHRIMGLNGGLAFVNLLPIGKLDGGRFAELLFDSIPESLDNQYAKAMSLIACGGLVALMIATRHAFFVPMALMIWGLKKKSETDDPHGSTRRGALRAKHRLMWASAYLALFLIGAAMQYSSPELIKKQQQPPKAAAFLFR